MDKRLTNGLLLLGIVGLLLIYFFTVRDLPGHIYTPAQQEFLTYNYKRSVSQLAPTLNFVTADGMVAAPGMATLMPNGESRVKAILNARYEEEQGVSVTVYDLTFQGHYVLTGSPASTTTVELFFPFPSNLETLHEVRFLVDEVEPHDANFTTRGISWSTTLQNGEVRKIDISYKANGANSFAYGLSRDQRSQIDIAVTIAGLNGSRVPASSLPATKQSSDGKNETFTWKYTGLIADRDVQLSLPTRLSFAQRIAELRDEFVALAGLAPLLVGLFVICLAGLFSLNGTRFALEGYLLAGLGLALFYPLLTFMSGMIGLILAAIITLAVVSGLLIVFLGIALGWAKIWRPLGLLLMVFLGFFSIGMMMPWRGLLLTSGGLLLIGTFMWAYARRARVSDLVPVTQSGSGTLSQTGVDPQPLAAKDSIEDPKISVNAYCFHCGRELEETYDFCPGCGKDARAIRRCEQCNHLQHVPPHTEPIHCVHCGHVL